MSKKEIDIEKILQNSILKLQQTLRKKEMAKQYAEIFVGADQKMKQKFEKDFNKYINNLSNLPKKIEKKYQQQQSWKQQDLAYNMQSMIQQNALDSNKLICKFYLPNNQEIKKYFYQHIRQFQQINKLIVEEDNDYMGKYIRCKSQNEKISFWMFKAQDSFVCPRQSNQMQILFSLRRQDKNIIFNFLDSLGHIIVCLQKNNLYNIDIQPRNTIKKRKYFIAIDYQDIMLLVQTSEASAQIIDNWFKLAEKGQTQQQDGKNNRKDKRIKYFLNNFINSDKFRNENNKISQKINKILNNQKIIAEEWQKKFEQISKKIKSTTNFKQVKQDVYKMLRKLMRISHLSQFLGIVGEIINHQGDNELEGQEKNAIIQALAFALNNFNIESLIEGKSDIYNKFITKLRQSGIDYLEDSQVLVQKQINDKKLLINSKLLLGFISKFKIQSFSKIKNIESNQQKLAYYCLNDSYQIKSYKDVFNGNIYFLYYFLGCAFDSLKDFARCGIYMPLISYKNFVREGSAFKIRTFDYAFKLKTITESEISPTGGLQTQKKFSQEQMVIDKELLEASQNLLSSLDNNKTSKEMSRFIGWVKEQQQKGIVLIYINKTKEDEQKLLKFKKMIGLVVLQMMKQILNQKQVNQDDPGKQFKRNKEYLQEIIQKKYNQASKLFSNKNIKLQQYQLKMEKIITQAKEGIRQISLKQKQNPISVLLQKQ